MTRRILFARWIACAIAVAAVVHAATPAASADAERAGAAREPLPTNLTIDEYLREQVEEAAAASPTLRRQLAVIAGAPAAVEVRVSLAPLAAFRRAEAAISRYEFGFVRARIALPAGADFVELLAHELEHVVEQIEGVDLAALERAGLATEDVEGVFETVRAREAGRAAAREVEQAARPGH